MLEERKQKIEFSLKNYLYSVYASLLAGIVLYLSYLLSSFTTHRLSLQEAVEPLMKGGFLFVLENFSYWLLLSIAITPIVLYLLRKKTNKKISIRLIVANMIVAIPISFLIIICFLIFHLIIGESLAI